MNIGGVVFPLEQQSRDDESVVYHGQYDTEGVPHTKSGDRQPVQVSIEVRCLRAVPRSETEKAAWRWPAVSQCCVGLHA